ncbi:MAG: aminotransferase class V-fold PLP-dependent enzyme [Oscillospiraceae bacterium]|nr:aminotransferase class V-fold PLP-dependent enzyme [Oscillospiraceae bacterium]
MLDKLAKIAARYEALEQRLGDPAVYGDREKLKELSREQKELAPIVVAYRTYRDACERADQARELLSDAEMGELAREELEAAEGDKARLEEELKRLLLPRDPNDDKNVILEIRSGIGGEEGALFAADLLRMYQMYAERRGFRMELASVNETELGGVKEAVATVEGEGAWSRLKFEAGTLDLAGVAGLGAALEYLHAVGRRRIAAREQALLRYTEKKLRELPGLRVLGSPRRRAGCVSYTAEPLQPLDVAMLLDSQGIAVRSGSHCAIPLHARLGLSGSVRVSPAFYNPAEEIDGLAAALARVLDSARKGGVLKDKANG